MNQQQPHSPSKPAHRPTVAALRERAPSDTRSAVLLSLIVCPRGGVSAHRHGQGAVRPS